MFWYKFLNILKYLYTGNFQKLIPDYLIEACIALDPKAQKQLYEATRSRMYVLVLRYIREHHLAEDVMIEAYVKVFKNIQKYRGDGAFEAWMRRIFVNECLMLLRKEKNIVFEPLTVLPDDSAFEPPDEFDYEEIMLLIEKLPAGCKTVFKMYVFDDLQHNEIAQLLNISISTSKSQYQLARNKLLSMIKNKQEEN